jgi:predicted esterase
MQATRRRPILIRLWTPVLLALGCPSPSGENNRPANPPAWPDPLPAPLAPEAIPADAPRLPDVAGEILPLEIPAHLPALVAVPGGNPVDPKPVVLATHGAYDNPESYCPFWQRIVKDRAFVLCTRGVRINDTAFYYPNHFFVDRENATALDALRSRFGARIATGRVLYAGYSQGAIHGAPLLQMRPETYPHAVFIEGGASWTPRTASRYRAAGGQRLLFVCGTAGCRAGATRSVRILSDAGLEVRFVWVPSAGHDYPPEMGRRIAEQLEWLVAGDPRWR